MIPSENIARDRTTALRQAVKSVEDSLVDFGKDTINSQAIG